MTTMMLTSYKIAGQPSARTHISGRHVSGKRHLTELAKTRAHNALMMVKHLGKRVRQSIHSGWIVAN